MDQDPEVIKQEIEETRSRMSETVEALAYKTDVPARARDAVNERVETIKGKVSGAIGTAAGAIGSAAGSVQSGAVAAIGGVTDSLPTGEDAAARFTELRALASRNPLGLAIGSVAVGFLIGLIVPVTQIERERVGPIGEQLTETAKTAANDAIEQGKSAVTQAIGDAIGAGAGARPTRETPGGTPPVT